MEDLDRKIDTMAREKLYALFEENSVRLGTINIRYTTKNQKLSLERLNDVYGSFERLLRSIPKELLNIEKKVRVKYQIPLVESRRQRLLTEQNNEIDRILSKVVADYRSQYAPFGEAEVEAFVARVEKSRASALEQVDRQMEKLTSSLDAELAGPGKIEPRRIHEMYGIDEQTQLHLRIVDTIRSIHTQFDALRAQQIDSRILEKMHESIARVVKIGKKVEASLPPSHMVAARKEWKMKVAREAMDLKQLILCIDALAGQLLLPKGTRNQEVVLKNWGKIEESLQGKEEGSEVMQIIQPFYALLNN